MSAFDSVIISISYPRIPDSSGGVVNVELIPTLHMKLVESDEKLLCHVLGDESNGAVEVFLILGNNNRPINLTMHLRWKLSFAEL